MKTVEITVDFDGYPNGKDKRTFKVGDEPELSDAFADLIVGKGLAREKGAPAKPTAQKPANPDQKDDPK